MWVGNTMRFPLALSPPRHAGCTQAEPRAHAGQGRGAVPSRAEWAGSQFQLPDSIQPGS